jgi:chaperonin cofactor prefoldin
MTHTPDLMKKLKDAEIEIARLQGQLQSTQRRCNELETELQRLQSP